ncbi:MAG: zinc-binding dehydrogenase, partial [Caulobacteraceae bacterium]|nr:zinc-binding dehydrogenase [Caulobacteraceae bacterium]
RLGAPSAMRKGEDVVFGHEFCCEVVETAGRFKAGALVVALPVALGPQGFEPVGYSHRFPGGLAEQMVLTDMFMHEVPNGLSAPHAALTEPLAVGEHAVAKADAAKDHAILVVGCGPVGLAVISALTARGLGPIAACDFSAERRTAAALMGADRVIDSAAVSPHAAWADFGVPADRAKAMMAAAMGRETRRPLIFECVGAPGVLQSLAEAAPVGARVVVAGVCMQTDAIEPFAFVSKEIELRFVLGYSAEEFAASLRALAEGRTRYAETITAIVDLAGTTEAFAKLQADKSQIKIMVSPQGG